MQPIKLSDPVVQEKLVSDIDITKLRDYLKNLEVAHTNMVTSKNLRLMYLHTEREDLRSILSQLLQQISSSVHSVNDLLASTYIQKQQYLGQIVSKDQNISEQEAKIQSLTQTVNELKGRIATAEKDTKSALMANEANEARLKKRLASFLQQTESKGNKVFQLQKEVQISSDVTTRANAEVFGLKQSLDSLTKQHAILKSSFENQSTTLNEANNQLVESLNNKTQTANQLESQMKAVTASLAAEKAQTTKLTQKQSHLTQQLKSVIDQNKLIRNKYADLLKIHENVKKTLTVTKTDCDTKLLDMNKTSAAINGSAQTWKAKFEKSNHTAVSRIEHIKEVYTEQNKGLNTKIQQQQAELNQQSNKVQSLESLKLKYENAVNSFKFQIESQNKKLINFDAVYKRLKQENAAYRSKMQQFIDQTNQARTEATRKSNNNIHNLEELKRCKVQMAGLEKDLTELNEVRATLQKRLSSASIDLVEATHKLQHAKIPFSTGNQLDENDAEQVNVVLQAKLTALNLELGKTKTELATYKENYKSMENEKIASVNQVTQVNDLIEQQNTKMKQLNETISKQKKQYEDLELENKNLTASVETLTKQVASLNAINIQKNEQLAKLQENETAINAKIAAFENERQAYSNFEATLKLEHSQALAAQKSEMEEKCEKTLSSLKIEVTHLEGKNKLLQDQIDTLSADNKERVSSIEKLTSDLAAQESNFEKLDSDFKLLQQQSNQIQSDNTSLQEKNEQLEKLNTKLADDLALFEGVHATALNSMTLRQEKDSIVLDSNQKLISSLTLGLVSIVQQYKDLYIENNQHSVGLTQTITNLQMMTAKYDEASEFFGSQISELTTINENLTKSNQDLIHSSTECKESMLSFQTLANEKQQALEARNKQLESEKVTLMHKLKELHNRYVYVQTQFRTYRRYYDENIVLRDTNRYLRTQLIVRYESPKDIAALFSELSGKKVSIHPLPDSLWTPEKIMKDIENKLEDDDANTQSSAEGSITSTSSPSTEAEAVGSVEPPTQPETPSISAEESSPKSSSTSETTEESPDSKRLKSLQEITQNALKGTPSLDAAITGMRDTLTTLGMFSNITAIQWGIHQENTFFGDSEYSLFDGQINDRHLLPGESGFSKALIAMEELFKVEKKTTEKPPTPNSTVGFPVWSNKTTAGLNLESPKSRPSRSSIDASHSNQTFIPQKWAGSQAPNPAVLRAGSKRRATISGKKLRFRGMQNTNPAPPSSQPPSS